MQKSVLIAESNRFFLTTLSEAFPLLGFTVVGTTSKLSALNVLAQKTEPDLLVFDLHLSTNGIAGLTDLQNLKDQLPDMKILVLAIHEAADQFVELILNAGFDGFWNKYDKRAGFINILNFLFP